MVEITPSTEMKIITLWQPWASWMFLIKQKETRSWSTKYRGLIAIHSANRKIGKLEHQLIDDVRSVVQRVNPALYDQVSSCDYPLGQILSVGSLSRCDQMCYSRTTPPPGWVSISQESELEQWTGEWAIDRYAWTFSESIILPKAINYKGGQGLRPLSSAVVGEICEVIKNG